MTKTMEGREVVASLNENIKLNVAKLNEKGIKPTLAIVRLGENPSDLSYERGATKRGETVGINVKSYALDEKASEKNVIDTIRQLNGDDSIHGILLFRPLPKGLNEEKIKEEISVRKDVDGITNSSLAGVFASIDLGFTPCTAQACMEILKYFKTTMKGKKTVIIGRSLVVGKPVAMLLLKEDATVTICHSKTENLPEISREADIVIVATGRGKSVGAEFFNGNQVVIDVGINVDEEGKLCGDVDFDNVKDNVKAITKVPGGVGTVTTSVLMKNVVEAANG